MRYPAHLLDEIRARLPVSAVVGRKVQLKKAGREWRGLSPFNAEKTPSFYVNDQKAFYHCFSSSKHGDIFTFLMETEGLSFPEAVERLAGEAGVDLPKPTERSVEQDRQRRGLHEVLELAAAYFQNALKARPGRAAREYLDRRDIGEDARTEFRIGYATGERFALRDHLAGKNVTPELMADAGLIVSGPDITVPYDRFRDRVIFPIEDARGRVVAFGGRAMSADVPAKYLNSPDTPLFSKGHLLYNYHRARAHAHERGTLIAVEGYVDVIALARAGFGHAVAPLGTALTPDQLGLMWRLADEPILCFDGDKAGRRAAFRAIDTALAILPPGKSVRFALLPEGQDPDDLVRAEGRVGVERVLDAAHALVDMLWTREIEAAPTDTPERRAAFATRLREAAGAIRDETVRRFYRDEMETRLRESRRAAEPAFEPRRERGRAGAAAHGGTGYLGRPVAAPGAALLARFRSRAFPPREAVILSILASHPSLLHAHADTLAELDLAEGDPRHLGDFLLDHAAHEEDLAPEVLSDRVARAGFDAALAAAIDRVPPGDRWMLGATADMARVEDALRQAFILQWRARTLHAELGAAERALAEDGSEANFAWLRDVQAQISSLDGAEADTEVV